MLVTVIQRCFEEKTLPEDLPLSSSIFFFKSKGDPNDRIKYRGLALQEVLLEQIAYENFPGNRGLRNGWTGNG